MVSLEIFFDGFKRRPDSERGRTSEVEQNFDDSEEGEKNPHSRSIEETFSEDQGLWGRLKSALGGNHGEFTDPTEGLEQYTTLGAEIVDPSEYRADQVVDWMDRRAEEGDVEAIKEVRKSEINHENRDTVTEKYDEKRLLDLEEGVINPSDYSVEGVQYWVDQQIESDNLWTLEVLREKEEKRAERKGVLEYEELQRSVDEYDPSEPEMYDSKEELLEDDEMPGEFN